MGRRSLTVTTIAVAIGLGVGLIGAWYSGSKAASSRAAASAARAAANPASASASARPAAAARPIEPDRATAERLSADRDPATLIAALGDASPQVRAAALEAVERADTQTPGMRSLLVAIATRESEPRGLRESALRALDRNPLTAAEAEAVAKAREQLGATAGR